MNTLFLTVLGYFFLKKQFLYNVNRFNEFNSNRVKTITIVAVYCFNTNYKGLNIKNSEILHFVTEEAAIKTQERLF